MSSSIPLVSLLLRLNSLIGLIFHATSIFDINSWYLLCVASLLLFLTYSLNPHFTCLNALLMYLYSLMYTLIKYIFNLK